jgi:hypothetical protein
MKKYLIKLLTIASIGALVSCASNYTYTNPSEFLPSYATVANNRDYVFYDYKPFFPEVTQLQLKAMQTRKFNKPLSEVVTGIKAMCGDSNGKWRGTGDGFACSFPVNRIFMFSGSDSKNNYFFVKYSPESKGADTILRIRMFGSHKNIGGEDTSQFTIDSLYQAQFKKIADSLFVNAIPLNPQEIE